MADNMSISYAEDPGDAIDQETHSHVKNSKHAFIYTKPPPVPQMIDDEPGHEFEVDRILDHQYTKRGHQRKLEYLLRFTGYGAEHDMWQHDVTNCVELVEYWDRKPVMQRCHASVCVAYRGKRSN